MRPRPVQPQARNKLQHGVRETGGKLGLSSEELLIQQRWGLPGQRSGRGWLENGQREEGLWDLWGGGNGERGNYLECEQRI